MENQEIEQQIAEKSTEEFLLIIKNILDNVVKLQPYDTFLANAFLAVVDLGMSRSEEYVQSAQGAATCSCDNSDNHSMNQQTMINNVVDQLDPELVNDVDLVIKNIQEGMKSIRVPGEE